MNSQLRNGMFAAVICGLGLLSAGSAAAGDLRAAFHTLSEETRVAVQAELAEVDLYLADPDGRWSAATERAVLRSVETIALNSGDRVHPRLTSPRAMRHYLEKLADGAYGTYLRRGDFSGGSAVLRGVNLGG